MIAAEIERAHYRAAIEVIRGVRARAIDQALMILVPAALFLAFFHVAVLDPTNVGWLLRGEDVGENALGLHAWLNDVNARGLRTYLLNFPDGVTMLFTDSNPLAALLLAPFARWLPRDFQIVGILYAASLVLHVAFARAILKPYAGSLAALWCGVGLLSLLPTLYVRVIHVNLFNHWIILWAIWVFASPDRSGRVRAWVGPIAVAAAVHNYLLVMVAAIWASAMLERFASARGSGARRVRATIVAGMAATLLMVLAILLAQGVDAGVVSSNTFGWFGMPVDAPWNPAYASFSTFLPAVPQAGDRQLESFQYLGFGILMLLVATPLIARSTEAGPEIASLSRRLPWLSPALAVLTLLAVSNRVDFAGRTLLDVPLPDAAMAALDPLRASSRLFWPVAYVLALVGVVAACRLPTRRSALLLGCALAFQIADIPGLITSTRAQTAGATRRDLYVRTGDTRWESAIAAATDITFVPGTATAQLDLFQEIAWRAVDRGIPVRIVYAARADRRTLDRVHDETRRFREGRLDPGRLYVLLKGEPLPRAAIAGSRVLDGVTVVLPATAIDPPSPARS